MSLKICAILLLVPAVICDVSRSAQYFSANDNLEFDLTPPQDPANYSFPKNGGVPVVPTCVYEGYFRDPYNCAKFYFCTDSQAIPAPFYCPHGRIFNELNHSCDEPKYVQC